MTTQPDVQRKLRDSILESIPELQDRPPTYEDLTPTNLPYLEAVVQETLRVSRTAGGVSRTGQFISDVLMGKGRRRLMGSDAGYDYFGALCTQRHIGGPACKLAFRG
jgi:hypothetical protein